MVRIWTEPYDPAKHGTPMGSEVGSPPGIERYWRAPTLEPHHAIFVRVASFTFLFHDIEQIRACLAFYSRKHHPSGRSGAITEAIRSGEVGGRYETERWYERLPLYLSEEPKRTRVVAALEATLQQLKDGNLIPIGK